jgi:hypothetical protein
MDFLLTSVRRENEIGNGQAVSPDPIAGWFYTGTVPSVYGSKQHGVQHFQWKQSLETLSSNVSYLP